ncbi:hypothetical protein [uncultured Kordia sp.]|uniref:hypothetical protein n=1 Tax=uncultured Kordia sp. TaxID=507699 RepID=UPI002623CD8F|nr:hypothetical protein [uncultured Kordia sp.]
MKKRSIKNLNLNKRAIASIREINAVKGGNTVYYCAWGVSADHSCYSPCGGNYATTGCNPNPIFTPGLGHVFIYGVEDEMD